MAIATTGRFKAGDYKGWRWEIYPDPASPTGWTRKIFNPRDTSNGGRPTEYFDWHDYQADAEDDADREAKAQAQAANDTRRSQTRANVEASKTRERDYEEDRVYEEKGRERTSRETTSRLDREARLGESTADRQARMRELELRLKEDRRQFDLRMGIERENVGLRRAELGADIIKTQAGMRGPLDAFQGFAAAQGTTNTGLSRFVGDLQSNLSPAFGGGTGGANPTPLTVGTLSRELTGQPATGMDAYGRPLLRADRQTALDAIDKRYQQGLANQGPGFLENMTEGQLAAFKSGGDYLGRDTDSEISYYYRSRPGQRSALAG